MARKPTIMKKGNKGLTVKINLWALDKYKDDFDSLSARLWLRGVVTHADTGEELKFNDPGQLLTILGKWNAKKLWDLRAERCLEAKIDQIVYSFYGLTREEIAVIEESLQERAANRGVGDAPGLKQPQ